jgi:phosphorylcholine metabolism protein LicD
MSKPEKSNSDLETLYKNVLGILNPLNLKFILFYGSLLGYYRDGNFIEGDDDVDFMVDRNDWDNLNRFLDELKNDKISIRYRTTDFIQIFYERLGPFDINVYDLYNDSILLKHDGNLLYKQSDIFPIKQVVYKDYAIWIPNNIENILELTYGKNWKTPQKKYIDYEPNRIVDKLRLRGYSLPNISVKRIR